MISRLADIYRIVTAVPTDALIAQRKAAVVAIVADEQVPAYLPEWIELVALGAVHKDAPGIKALVKALQDQQPSFPSDPVERALDLRVTAAVCLGHYLESEKGESQDLSRVVSGLLLSSTRLPERSAEPRFSALIDDLRQVAQTLLDADAVTGRQRTALALADIKGGDVTAVAASLNVSLQALVERLNAAMRADREELQILWWAFGRYSTTLAAPYASLAPSDAAIASAIELSSLMLLPPVPAAGAFLQSVLADKPDISFVEFVGQVPTERLRLLVPKEGRGYTMLRTNPGLFPVTWLASRLVESEKAPWKAEFNKKTLIATQTARTTLILAEQIFSERTALGLIGQDWETA